MVSATPLSEIHTTDRRGRESDFYFVMSISIKIYGRTDARTHGTTDRVCRVQPCRSHRRRASFSPSRTRFPTPVVLFSVRTMGHGVSRKRIIIYCILCKCPWTGAIVIREIAARPEGKYNMGIHIFLRTH